MNKITIKKICLLLLLGGLASVSREVQAVTKTRMLQKDPLWQFVLATKKFATPYMKDLLIKVPQLKDPSTPYALGAAGLATLLGIYAARKPLQQKAKQGWEYVQWGYNKLPWPLQVVISAPVAVVGGTLAAHYISEVTPDKATGELLKKTVFGYTAGGILHTMTGFFDKINFLSKNENKNPLEEKNGDFIEHYTIDDKNITPSLEELSYMCSEDGLQQLIRDYQDGECKNLLLYGLSDLGKTTFTTMLFQALAKEGLSSNGIYVNAQSLTAEIYVGTDTQKFKTLISEMESLKKGDLVTIDEADQIIKKEGDFGHGNSQINYNKWFMKVLEIAHKHGLPLIAITNVENPMQIPATVRNRFLRITEQSNGGYIVEKELPNQDGRINICKHIVEDRVKNPGRINPKFVGYNLIVPNQLSLCAYIAKYTDGCDNSELAKIVDGILRSHLGQSSSYNPTIISAHLASSRSIINKHLSAIEFKGIREKLASLQSISAADKASLDTEAKTVLEQQEKNYKQRLNDSLQLRTELILNEYQVLLSDTLSNGQSADLQIAALKKFIKPDLKKALKPHKERIKQLKIASVKSYEQINATNQKFSESKKTLLEKIKAIEAAYQPEKFDSELNEYINKLKETIETFFENPSKDLKNSIDRGEVDLEKFKIQKPLESALVSAFSSFLSNGLVYASSMSIQKDTTTAFKNLEQKQADLKKKYENPAAVLSTLKDTKKTSEAKVDVLKKIILKEKDIHGSDNSAKTYEKICAIYEEVKFEYEKYKYHLPLMSRDDLLKVAQEVQRELDYDTCKDEDIQRSNHDQIILNKLGVTVDKTSFGSTLKSITINTLKATWNCATYPFTSAKQRRTVETQIGDRLQRHGLRNNSHELVETLCNDPITSKNKLQQIIVGKFLKQYKYMEEVDEKNNVKLAIQNIFKSASDKLHIRKGRDKILEVSTDGKTFVSLSEIQDGWQKKQYENEQNAPKNSPIET